MSAAHGLKGCIGFPFASGWYTPLPDASAMAGLQAQEVPEYQYLKMHKMVSSSVGCRDQPVTFHARARHYGEKAKAHVVSGVMSKGISRVHVDGISVQADKPGGSTGYVLSFNG